MLSCPRHIFFATELHAAIRTKDRGIDSAGAEACGTFQTDLRDTVRRTVKPLEPLLLLRGVRVPGADSFLMELSNLSRRNKTPGHRPDEEHPHEQPRLAQQVFGQHGSSFGLIAITE